MDGLPGLQRAVETGQTDSVKPMKKMVGKFAPTSEQGRRMTRVFGMGHLMLVALISSLGTALLMLLVLSGMVRWGEVCLGDEYRGIRWERGSTG